MVLLCMMLAASSLEACPRDTSLAVSHRRPHIVHRQVSKCAQHSSRRKHLLASGDHNLPAVSPCVRECRVAGVGHRPSFIRRHTHWLWAGAGVIAGLVIENNVHSHGCAAVIATVVEKCVPHEKPKKDKCPKK